MSDTSDDYDWVDLLARIKKEIRRGADRVEVDLDNDVVRGMSVTGRSYSND